MSALQTTFHLFFSGAPFVDFESLTEILQLAQRDDLIPQTADDSTVIDLMEIRTEESDASIGKSS